MANVSCGVVVCELDEWPDSGAIGVGPSLLAGRDRLAAVARNVTEFAYGYSECWNRGLS